MWSLYTDRALVARSKDGADPYVSFILLPDKKATTKRKTATKKKDLSPEFNERQDKQIGCDYRRSLRMRGWPLPH